MQEAYHRLGGSSRGKGRRKELGKKELPSTSVPGQDRVKQDSKSLLDRRARSENKGFTYLMGEKRFPVVRAGKC